MIVLSFTVMLYTPADHPCRECGARIVVYQGSCGCFVSKCLLCDDIGWAWCGAENLDEHEAAFNEAGEDL